MKRVMCLLALLMSLTFNALFRTTPGVSAITYGFVDSNNSFSNTGAFVVKSITTGQIFPICSGTMITANVFLTASHCTIAFNQDLALRGFAAYVSLDAAIPFGTFTSIQTNLLPVAYVVTNPNYTQRQNDPGDIGALILESPVVGITPATLAHCGLLDQLADRNGLKNAVLTAVGYGVQERGVGQGSPSFQDVNPVPRMYAFSSFNALNNGYLRLSQNPAKGDGGTCFGDSGGPDFLSVNGERILVAITITGDSVCRATNVDYRLDTISAQGFLAYLNGSFGTSIPILC